MDLSCGLKCGSISTGKMTRPRIQQLFHLRTEPGAPLEDIEPAAAGVVSTNKTLETVTFRIPVVLKRQVEEVAERRGVTTTKLVVEALSFEVENEPPRWFVNYMAGRKPGREAFPTPKKDCSRHALEFVLANPRGVRTWEVARATDQTIASAYNTLVALADAKKIVRHGDRNRRLWTAVGIIPIPRIESIEDAIKKVLLDAAGVGVDQITLQDTVSQLVERATSKKVSITSLVNGIYRAMRKGVIKKAGASGRGVLYVLAKKNMKTGGVNANISN